MDLGAALQEGSGSYQVATEVMVSGPVLSLDAVRPQFAEYLIRVEKMKRDAEAVMVDGDESLKFAVALGGEAKKIVKALDAKKKEVTAEAGDFVKSVNGFVKMFTDRLDEIEKALKKKIGDYQYKVELERRKQEEAARKAAEELQARLRAEAEEANRKAMEEARKKAEEEAARLRAIAEEEARKRKASEDELKAMRDKQEAERLEAVRRAEEEAKKHEVRAPTVLAPVIPETQRVTRTETGTSAYQVKTWRAEITNEAAVPREYCTADMRKINDALKMGTREIAGVRIYEETSTRLRT
jgi:hypothetical protein